MSPIKSFKNGANFISRLLFLIPHHNTRTLLYLEIMTTKRSIYALPFYVVALSSKILKTTLELVLKLSCKQFIMKIFYYIQY